MNFIFISPHFPTHFFRFCRALKNRGVNVLGIADAPYETLPQAVRDSLTEYYRVDNLENYDSVLRAAGYFTHRYGKIDFIESNNEYWLMQDARLRSDFNVTTGPKSEDMAPFKHKSAMKECYRRAGVPCARYAMATDEATLLAFAEEVGYPIVVKPDDGVGAGGTYRLTGAAEVSAFFAKPPERAYIAEEFIRGTICSYDAILDAAGEAVYEASNVTPVSIMDIVNDHTDPYYYICPDVPADIRDAGRRCAQAFGVKSRFVHFEFFRLTEAQTGLGSAGQIVALEVNMRPSGGFSTDMINYAGSVDVYEIWADMMTARPVIIPPVRERAYCLFLGRRDAHDYPHTDAQVQEKFGAAIVACDRMPPVFAGAMGDRYYLARFSDSARMEEMIAYALA